MLFGFVSFLEGCRRDQLVARRQYPPRIPLLPVIASLNTGSTEGYGVNADHV